MKRVLKKFFNSVAYNIPVHDEFVIADQKELDGLKILHLSDLHIHQKSSLIQLYQMIQNINNTACDCVVITGDIVDTKVQYIAKHLKLFRLLKHPVYFVSGNHDLVYGYSELIALLKECGITILDNDCAVLQKGQKKIVFAGLSDRYSCFFGIKRSPEKLLQKLSMYKDSAIVFLAHQPKDYKYALQACASIFLCGHTHGGQIVPFDFFVALFQPFLAGHYRYKEMNIYVNRGIGAWGIKGRIGIKSEIALLNFFYL